MIPSADTILSRFVVRAKFRHMQVLVKLAELGSMRRVAEAINMTQPAVSQKVAELEKLIGAELFFRHAKGVEPTEAARELLPVAHRVMAALQDGSEALAQRLRANSGVVRVAATPAAIGGLLLDTLGPFSSAHPDIQVTIIELSGTGTVDGQILEDADVAGIRQPQIVPKGWDFVPCLDDRLIAVCGAQHPLAGARDVRADTLGQYRWLMNRIGSVARRRFEEMFATHGWSETARGSLVIHVPELTRELLMTQDFLAILPQSVAQPWLKDGRICTLDAAITAPLPPLGVMCPRTGLGPAAERFIAHMRSHFGRAPGGADPVSGAFGA